MSAISPEHAYETVWIKPVDVGLEKKPLSRRERDSIVQTLTLAFGPLLGPHTVFCVVERQSRHGRNMDEVAEHSRRELAEILSNS
ncbi:MAG: hypothetical protein QOK10_1694 [Pseudonocardiales bacterium]|jgi:hypothetical protein|nr:hypothetical protein [Pseudonocardiales bacterium]